MKMKQKSRKVMAWLLVMSLCLASFWISGGTAQAADPDTREAVTLGNPVIDAKEGKISWDCVYFGDYWQSKYIPQPGNQCDLLEYLSQRAVISEVFCDGVG